MKKTHFLQTLYLQKPLVLIILIATLSTLPWIGLGDFYTKGEPREAVLAISMIENGEWIIPSNYADEFAYKPPLNHWLIAGGSLLLNGGEVTPFTSRLPSALSFIIMIAVCFMFFARRRSTLEAFISCLIVITCFEIHRAAVTTRVDMLLTVFMVTGIIQLYTWYEGRRIGQAISAILLLSMAVLVKGPVGIVLPCLIFGVYLLTQKEKFFRAVLRCVVIAIPAFIIPLIWYYLAYREQGDAFLTKVFAENFGRFLRISTEALGTDYNLGVENPWYYYPISLLAGFIPWTILPVVSLFFFKYKFPSKGIKTICVDAYRQIMGMDKVLLYSFFVIFISLLFYTVPASKRSTYIMLIYPFIGIFMARFFIYLSEFKPLAIRISTSILLGVGSLMLLIMGLAYTHVINIEELSYYISKRERTLNDIKIFSDLFINPGWLGLLTATILLIAVWNAIYLLSKRVNLKVLIVGFGLMFAINVFLDAYLLPGLKNGYSARPFAEMVSQKYDLKGKTYVANNLLKYYNLYGMNFYLGGGFKNIEKEKPKDGYFLMVEINRDAITEAYGAEYDFELLESSSKWNEHKSEILLYRIQRKIQ